MTKDINFSELERYMQNPTIEDCFKNGHTHAAYGWSQRPWGHWTDEQKASYVKGWNDYHERKNQ